MALRFRGTHIMKAAQAVRSRLSQKSGNILVYIVVLMVIFALLGVAMVSLFSTSISSSATANDTRRATFLSESGIRYAASELRAADFSKTTITTLNQKVYNVSGAGSFDLNVFSPWFESASSYDTGTQLVNVDVPEGEVPAGYLASLPAGDPDLLLVNYDSSNLSNPDAQSPITGFTAGTPTSFQIQLGNDLVTRVNKQVALAVKPFAGGQTLPPPGVGVLDLKLAAKNVFPQAGGAFTVKGRDFYYMRVDSTITDRVRLMGVTPAAGKSFPDDTTIAADDPVILTPLRNRLIVSEGRSGQVTFGNNIDYAAAIVDHSPLPISRKPDIAFDEEANLPGVLSQVEQNVNVVNVYGDPGNRYLSLSTSGGSFGASWFKDTRSIGGIRSFCQSGGCLFNTGFRAFFIFNFTGATGDGFTFSVLNGSNNDNSSVGGDIELSELLAYAGDSRTTSNPTSASDFLDGRSGLGLQAPKMAVEFDGRRNSQNQTICQDATTVNQGSRFDPDFSGSDRDVVQYVFWGKDSLINAPCRINTFVTPNTNKSYDDNRHDTVNQIWAYDSGSHRVSSPAVDGSDPANVKIYAGRSSDTTQNDAGRLIRLNPSNGTTNPPGWSENPDTTSGNDDDIDSSPTLDSSGDIYIGNDSFLISRYNSSGAKAWSTALVGNIEGKPFISDTKNRVYVVTDKTSSFNARLYSLSKSGAVQWFREIGATDGDYTSSPVVRYDSSADRNFIYVGSLNGSLYVVRDDGGAASTLINQYPTSGAIRSTPAINPAPSPNPVSNHVYFGSDDGTIYFLRSDGSEYRLVTPSPIAPVVSSPAVTSDGARVYVGSNNGHLYALNSLTGFEIWKYPAGSDRIGDVRGAPTIAADGAVIFGSDDGHLYALNPDGTLRWKFPAVGSIGAVRSKPAIGPDGIIYFGAEDGKLYAIDPAVNDPQNIPNLYLTPAQLDPSGSYGNNWFTEATWAVRVEVQRSTTPNGSGKFEYTLKTWMKKCVDGVNCTNVLGQFFENTRFEYDWTTAGITPMTQTIEFSNTPDLFHDRFDRFLFGFTSASTASQTIDIRKFQLSFIRPNDLVAND